MITEPEKRTDPASLGTSDSKRTIPHYRKTSRRSPRLARTSSRNQGANRIDGAGEIKETDLKSLGRAKGSVRSDQTVALEVWGMADASEAAVGRGKGVPVWSSGGGLEVEPWRRRGRNRKGEFQKARSGRRPIEPQLC